METHISDIMKRENIKSRQKLVVLAIAVAKAHKCSAADAIRKIEAGQIDLDQVNESIIKSFQKKVPEVKSEDDQTT